MCDKGVIFTRVRQGIAVQEEGEEANTAMMKGRSTPLSLPGIFGGADRLIGRHLAGIIPIGAIYTSSFWGILSHLRKGKLS
jgi:hypothetical protein